MNHRIYDILKKKDIQPILVDIGASGEPPSIWKHIAPYSTYIGFDPDQRDFNDVSDGAFKRSVIVNEALISTPSQTQERFYLTRSPHCSSSLSPDMESLANYLFSDFFIVEKEILVPASSLNTILNRLDIQTVDWLKTDSQGTDLRLFQSLATDVRNRVLALDIEPGLIDAYKGEDLFVDAHRELLKEGFWLSALDIKGSVRLRRTTLQAIEPHYSRLKDSDIYQAVRPSPGWCEARYLRTIDSLSDRSANMRDYTLLWIFALIDQQWGYALDVAHAIETNFGKDSASSLLRDLPLQQILQKNRSLLSYAKRFLPRNLKNFLKRL